MHNNRVFSRCISNLILVVREDVPKSLQLDKSLSLIIPIYGLLLFEKSYTNLFSLKKYFKLLIFGVDNTSGKERLKTSEV
jgi:hypothetical protein